MMRREALRAVAVTPLAMMGLWTRPGSAQGNWDDGSILMVYSTREGQTRRITEVMAEMAREAGYSVQVADMGERGGFSTGTPSAILVAGSIRMGRHHGDLVRWVRTNQDLLDRVPSAVLSVSLSAAQESKRPEAVGYVEDLLQETGWSPTLTCIAPGALAYTRYGGITRRMMRKIAEDGGLPTDTSRDHEFTDWAEVRSFTADFLERVPDPVRSDVRVRT
jgi:menaquinone-dependent protoporphyrinogen oxidase